MASSNEDEVTSWSDPGPKRADELMGPDHRHSWVPAGLSHGQIDTIPALCGCGATRRFAVPDGPIEITADGAERAVTHGARLG
jgi:hypothetical protein